MLKHQLKWNLSNGDIRGEEQITPGRAAQALALASTLSCEVISTVPIAREAFVNFQRITMIFVSAPKGACWPDFVSSPPIFPRFFKYRLHVALKQTPALSTMHPRFWLCLFRPSGAPVSWKAVCEVQFENKKQRTMVRRASGNDTPKE